MFKMEWEITHKVIKSCKGCNERELLPVIAHGTGWGQAPAVEHGGPGGGRGAEWILEAGASGWGGQWYPCPESVWEEHLSIGFWLALMTWKSRLTPECFQSGSKQSGGTKVEEKEEVNYRSALSTFIIDHHILTEGWSRAHSWSVFLSPKLSSAI